ncbi:MAG: uroporphyrinogen decarboxylase family protein [Armatimonadota bacterium]|nr:uroporphyrinogen decarboxylase family protein [Armatimonadota bacterium]
MLQIDFKQHNQEVKEVWDAYFAGNPIRVPMFIGINVRYYLLSPWLNPRKIDFQQYSEAPDLMMDTQLEFLCYVYHNIHQDAEMGMPKEAWNSVKVDLQNCYDAGWFGCPVRYHDGQVSDTEPILNDDNKRMLFDRGMPDPFRDGIMAKNLQFYERMKERAKTHTFHGIPIGEVYPAGLGSDGVFTAAANLRGAMEICMDIYEDPDYVHELLDYLTEAIILRIKAWRGLLGEPAPESLNFADDSSQLLSCEAYREFVLPRHKRMIKELAGKGPHYVHLCGDAAHLFKIMRDELNVMGFDTGFPIDFAKVRRELGPEVQIKGGPSIHFLTGATPEEVKDEVKRILATGIMEGGKFILREGNNLAPGAPENNIAAMYDAVREFGKY